MSALPILRRRRERRIQNRQRSSRRMHGGLVSLGLLLSALLGAGIFVLAFGYASVTADLPSVDLLPILINPTDGLLLQPTRIYDRTGGNLLATLSPQDTPRRYASLNPVFEDHIPDELATAIVTLADPGFWQHDGYTLSGLDDPSAHPTLAQTLAADLLLWNEAPSLQRAIRERILAAQLTSRFGRERILEWYINTASFGRHAYGIDSAAQLYFNKSATTLTPGESILLAAVSQSPALNPFDAPQAAIENQHAAIDLLLEQGQLTAEDAARYKANPPRFYSIPARTNAAPAFVELALSQLDASTSRARIERGGMTILTSLDYSLQQQAACAAQTQLARIAGQPDPADCASARHLPPLALNSAQPDASASVVVLDPRYGQVLALVGELHADGESTFLSGHRPGTLLTPFIYLTGFTRGLSPATLTWDIPPADAANLPETFTYHGPVRLRTAFANDYIIPAETVLQDMSLAGVLQTMRLFGLEVSPSASGLLASETPVSPLAVAQAYSIFATEGILSGREITDGQVRPSAVLKVSSVDGQTLLDWSAPQTEQIVSPQLAYLINHVLGDESARWPSQGRPNAFELSFPLAAKSGYVPGGSDFWAAGYTPNRTVIVWMGGEGLSTRPAAGLWAAVMQTASQGQVSQGWPMPVGVQDIQVCDPSGMLPSAACPNVVKEVFLDGYQPVQADTLFKSYAINRETGLLATVFTPPQLIEEKVYMSVPPEAQAWAQQSGLSVPPTTYDTIQQPPSNPNAHITFPGMFASLGGKVSISGSASGDDFSFYRLQYGQGLNPSAWVQVGADVSKPVIEAPLAEWDTSGLNGLYALQLLVVRKDGRIETATVQVTVSNP